MLTCVAAFAIASGPDFRQADTILLAGKPALRIEGRANTFIQSGQTQVTLDMLSDGRFALAWESRRQRKGLSGAYTRIFDPQGRPLSREAGTTRDTEFPQLAPSVALGSDGKADVAYLTRFRDGRQTPAYLGETRLESGKGLQSDPLIAKGPNGQIVAAWVGEVGHLQTRIFVQRFDSRGKPLGRAARVSEIDQIESVPSLASNADGFAIVWQRAGTDRKPTGLQARVFDWSGTPRTPARTVGDAQAIEPSLGLNGDGFIVGWIQPNSAGTFAAGAQRLTSDLLPNGAPIRLAPQSGDQVAIAVSGRADGRFALAWNHRTDSDTDVYAQLFSASGNPEGKAFRATQLSKGYQGMAESTGSKRLVYSSQGLAIAWHGDTGKGDSVSANFTLIQPRADRSLASLINVQATKVDIRQSSGKPMLKFDRMITVTTPHDPPISNFKLIANPWDVQIPMANGGFNAYSQTSFTPPDCQSAVGPGFVVVVVNDGIAFYRKDGTQTYTNNMRQTNGFWGSLAASDDFIYDPETFYDTQTGRWFVMASQGNGNVNSAALVGVSDDSDPNGTWYLYKFDATGLAGDLFDSPNFGTDANVLYITGDGFGRGANYPVYCIEKAPLLSGQNPTIIRSATLPTSTQSAGIPPVQDSGSRYYMIEHKEGGNNTSVDLIALANPLSSPSFTRFTLTVPAYAPPGDPPQSGSGSRVNTFDGRFWSVKYKNGFLWATHHINSRVVARWYQIDPRGWPTSGNNPVLVQSGQVDLGSDFYTFFSGIGVDDGNNAGIVYGRSRPSEFYSASHSSRRMTDALGTMSNHTIDKVSTGAYTGGRWGDYHDSEADPEFPGLMWGFAEWAEGQSWRAWVQPFYVTNELWANVITPFKGTRTAGSYLDTIYDDNRVMSFRSTPRLNVNDPFIGVEFRSKTRRTGQVSVNLQFAYQVDGAGFTLKTRLLNRNTGLYDLVDTRAASLSEQLANVNVPNPTDYVQADGSISCRMTVEATGPVSSPVVNLSIDRWAWIEN